MPVQYGNGVLYNAGDTYGRVSLAVQVAQGAEVRQTALQVIVTDQRTNRWEAWAGSILDTVAAYRVGSDFDDGTEQNYYSYRATAAMVQLGNGNIIRVRIGNGSTVGDRQIYVQTITDPTVVSQWTTWAVLYSGTHYGLGIIQATSSTYHVYHTKSDGLYKNNSLKWSQTNLVQVRPVTGQADALWVTKIVVDIESGTTNYRDMDAYYSSNIESVAPTADPINFRWYRNMIEGYKLTDGRIARIQSNGIYTNPRARNNGDSITVSYMPSFSSNVPTVHRLIRGLAGGIGHNTISGPKLFLLSDGFYYLFYAEWHTDDDFAPTINSPLLVWQRSKDLQVWSEPVAVGFNDGIAGLVESGGYVYLAGYNSVLRRPATVIDYDISNYVPELSLDCPRDNQEGSGSCTVANPDGINDVISTLSDRALAIRIGLLTTAGYEYVNVNGWWIKTVVREGQGEINRLKINFGDVWTRLSNPLRDTFNFVGQLDWADWWTGGRNKAFNYYFATSQAFVEDGAALSSSGICLYTGWKGSNPTAQVRWSAVSAFRYLVFRYVDANNYYYASMGGGSVALTAVVAGVGTELASVSGSGNHLKVVVKWKSVQVYVETDLKITYTSADELVQPGYVGFGGSGEWTCHAFTLIDWEYPLTDADLIKTALAMGDYHDVVVGSGDARQLAIIWGPQTDLPSPGDALKNLLEHAKLDIVWRDSFINVGKFTDGAIFGTYENTNVETGNQDEANRRINLANVDGNENTWIEVDVADTRARDRQINAYFDLPELLDQSAVTARALEEIRRSKMGRSLTGQLPFQFDLQRMDAITWKDNNGLATSARVEGFSVAINQSTQPSQRETLDMSTLEV